MNSKLIALMAAVCLSSAAMAQTAATPASPRPVARTDNPVGGQPPTDSRSAMQNSPQQMNGSDTSVRTSANPQDRSANQINDCTQKDGRVDNTDRTANGALCDNGRGMQATGRTPNRDKREVRP